MGKRVILGIVVAATLIALLAYSQQKREPIKVSGFIEADEIRLGSRVGGRVAAVDREPPQVVLGLHISHGLSSAFQTLGVRHARLQFLKAGFGKAVAAVIVLGNCAIPLSIALGLVGKEVV